MPWTEPGRENRWERRQRRIAVLLLLLIPLGIPVGLLAPNSVSLVEGPAAALPELDTATGAMPRLEDDYEPMRIMRKDSPPNVQLRFEPTPFVEW